MDKDRTDWLRLDRKHLESQEIPVETREGRDSGVKVGNSRAWVGGAGRRTGHFEWGHLQALGPRKD